MIKKRRLSNTECNVLLYSKAIISNSSTINSPWVDYQTSYIGLDNFRFGGVQQLWFQIDIARKHEHAILTIILPIYVLAISSCCSFLIPRYMGERVGFIVTVHLALVFIITLLESEVAPCGDKPRPRIFNLIAYINM